MVSLLIFSPLLQLLAIVYYHRCHELGHAWGLPHRDEIVGNPDLGTCLDYTIKPQNNMKVRASAIPRPQLHMLSSYIIYFDSFFSFLTVPPPTSFISIVQPDEIDFENLKTMYGEANIDRGRRLRMPASGDGAEILESSYVYGASTNPSPLKGRSARILLHKSDLHEVWEEDLGNGRRLMTKVLLSSKE